MRLGCGMFLCSFAVLCCVSLTNGCGEITKPYGAVTFIYGKMSGAKYMRFSVATCPRGTVVIYCTCSSYDHCDGTDMHFQSCTTINQRLNLPTGVQAVAFCGQGESSDYEFVTHFPKDRTKATCTSGFKVLACGVQNSLSHYYCCHAEINESGTGCQMREEPRKGGTLCYIQHL